jgi:quercetin dioxygenase-like cupin family protein
MMTVHLLRTDRFALPAMFAMAIALASWGTAAQAQAEFVVEVVAEKPLEALPDGNLFWHAETFATLDEAKAAATATGVPAELGGKVWLLTLGPKDMAGHGGEWVATIGPIDRFDAPGYLMRINVSAAPPSSKTSVHSHPGSEAIYILSGEATIRWPNRTDVVGVGESLAGAAPNTAMEATSTGDDDLVELIMFVVDSTLPFGSPAKLD